MARRVAVVTGSTRGIGRAILERLAADHDCVVHGRRDAAAADEVAKVLADAGAESIVALADLADPDELDELTDAVLDRFGHVDTLVANAASTAFRPLTDLAGRHSRLTFATVVDSLVELVHRCAPTMGPGGRILTIGGLDARFAQSGHGLLGGAKAALEALTRSWAVELGPRGVTANTIVPGPVLTDSLETYLGGREDVRALLVDNTPVGRLCTPSDIAEVAAFLVSPAAAMISGQVVTVDGGISAQGGPWGAMRDLW
ncbi:SDR family NAD(P)-dependent oxidoreductase [Pseudonocardia sp. N23]|uniref:SDR family NAD(P)-dependent oxidoreductase n=1 Tax=Pseudonocardia sp. N23 TaxID=1987376 RepID=UPI000BFC9265|nr:SDR family oxidoreductase [Pseudonocardia sp. N23]GAY08314.1 3-oxoacyl-[acyl-carrier protein] reductase [Pseudonocardia sp. N23]